MLRTSLCLSLLAAGVSAQSFIVPSKLSDAAGTSTATATGNSYDSQVFWYSTTTVHPVRVQQLWPVSDIPQSAALLKSMAFRRPNTISNACPAATATLSIDLTVGPNTVAGRSTTFTNNHGPVVTTVFNGTVNLPPATIATGPAPFLVVMPFTQNFAYVSTLGNTLVADMKITSYSPITATATWFIDAVGTDAGLRTNNGAFSGTCKFSNGVGTNAIGHTNPVLGGTWNLQYQSGNTVRIPSGLVAIGLLGFIGAGASWNGIPLPFTLPGTPPAPNLCTLNTSIALTAPLTENTGLYNWPGIPVPNDPSLADASFFDQGLFLDAQANALGIVTTWSSKWTIKTGNAPLGAKLYQYINNGNPTPSPTTGFSNATANIAEFTY